MNTNLNKKRIIKYFLVLTLFCGYFSVLASTTDGTIDAANHSALLCLNDDCTNTTQINFLTTNGRAVHVTNTELTGDVWSETFGWINLDPSLAGVSNTEDGVLGGYAWGENAGWINFSPTQGGVTINDNGQFTGFAWAQNYGWIKFDCNVVNACVTTDWRANDGGNNGGGSSGGGGDITPPPDDDTIEPPPVDGEQGDDLGNGDDGQGDGNQNDDGGDDQGGGDVGGGDNNSGSDDTEDGTGGGGVGDGQDNENTQVEQIVEEINTVITETFEKVKDLTKKVQREIVSNLTTKEGKVVSKAVSTTGVISGASISLATALFANPLSFSELFLIPLRLWGLILLAFGIKKRNVPWGTVYDSVTKQPLDPAYVVLQDLNGNEVATSITDLDGRYGFLVPPGQYRMIANKTNYEFPSKKLSGKLNDELYQELYFNEIIDVPEGGVISKNIPLDPIKFDWNEFAKKDRKLMKFFSRRDIWITRITNLLFYIGFAVTVIAVAVSPVSYNIAILVVYLVLFILKRTILKPRAFGYVKQLLTKNPLSFAVVRIFFAGGENEVIHKITDKTGKYYCLIPNGKYYVKIENKNVDESYSLVHTSEPIEIKNGYLNKKFEV